MGCNWGSCWPGWARPTATGPIARSWWTVLPQPTRTLRAKPTLKACLLGPSPVGDPTRLPRLVNVAVSGDKLQPVFVWYALARGMYEYRTGKFDAAVTTSRANREHINATGGPDPAIAMVIAVRAFRCTAKAMPRAYRGSLAQAKKLIDEKFLVHLGGEMNELWHDWLAAQLLYREAETLLESKTPVIVNLTSQTTTS